MSDRKCIYEHYPNPLRDNHLRSATALSEAEKMFHCAKVVEHPRLFRTKDGRRGIVPRTVVPRTVFEQGVFQHAR